MNINRLKCIINTKKSFLFCFSSLYLSCTTTKDNQIMQLTNSQFRNHIEKKGVENIDLSDYINIDGVDYILNEEQENEVARIQDELEQVELSEQIQFEKDCNTYNEVGFKK